MPAGPVELRVRAHQWRSLLDPTAVVEVWRGAELVGELPGTLVALLLDHHLSAARLQGAVARAMEDTMRQRRPPAVIPPDVQAARRARRRGFVVGVVLLLTGCTGAPRVEILPLLGQAAAQLAADRADCEGAARRGWRQEWVGWDLNWGASTATWVPPSFDTRYYVRCLEARGYRVER